MRRNFWLLLIGLSFPLSVFAYDLTDKLSISGTATQAYHWLKMTKGYVGENDRTRDRGAAVVDLSLSFRPAKNDEFLLRASFAKGSGFHDPASNYPFTLNYFADDLFLDLQNINGHPRDHLQELWYAHKFDIKKDLSLKITAGIIDSTAFIDDNSYANDEVGQFMNEVFVNNPSANLPSYDAGVAAEFEWGRFHLRLAGMHSKNENEYMDIRRYNWIGVQVGYRIETLVGEGNYRVFAYTTNRRFENWKADRYKALKGIGVSFDQRIIKDRVGAFFRAGLQDDSAKVDYKGMFSFGLNLNGSIWGRKDDEAGFGYAYLKAPSKNDELRHSQVFEGYVKFKLLSYKFLSTDITLDYQYIRDRARDSENNKKGQICGIRFNINF